MAITVEEAVAEALPKPPVYAVGVVRVSEVGDRVSRPQKTSTDRQRRAPRTRRSRRPEQFKTHIEQRQRIEDACRSAGLELAEVFVEMDVSGRKPLDKRKGLLPALQAIEAGHAQVLVVAYFDRLVRSLDVQSQVLKRVEKAGGRAIAVDFGEIQTKSAAQWLSATVVGAMAEYQSRSVGERLASTQAMAIADGVAIGSIPPGYSEDPATHRLVVHAAEAQVMKEAFEMRAEGASYGAVRRHMAQSGIVRGLGSVKKLLASRTYTGELFHGAHRNPDSHKPIVDTDTFARVQARGAQKGQAFRAVPGRQSSPLLLAGQRVLKCACGKSLQSATQVQKGKSYRFYRCPPNLTCPRRVCVVAKTADEAVASYVRKLLTDEAVTEGTGLQLSEARQALDSAQSNYSRAQRNLALSEDESEARAILSELKTVRDQASERVNRLEQAARVVGDAWTLNADRDWDELTLAEQRKLLHDVRLRVVVKPAGVDDNGRRLPRGAARLDFFDFRDDPS